MSPAEVRLDKRGQWQREMQCQFLRRQRSELNGRWFITAVLVWVQREKKKKKKKTTHNLVAGAGRQAIGRERAAGVPPARLSLANILTIDVSIAQTAFTWTPSQLNLDLFI